MAQFGRQVFYFFMVFILVAQVASVFGQFLEDEQQQQDEDIVMSKRIPHPSWRSNVRINHIQHQQAPPLMSAYYDRSASRPLLFRWAKRPYAMA
uniref:Uncharacterized protein n=1 Tax=Panagrellus redivivus TaxID=6233 RepID=A0A7E4V6B0_PANRE